jgi:hypothetical protein
VFACQCGALHAVRDHMYSRLDSITSGAFGQLVFDEPLDTVLLGLLGNNYWGDNAPAVDSCVRSFLVEAWAARELAVARRPATVLDWRWRWTWSMSMYLGLCVFGYLCRFIW